MGCFPLFASRLIRSRLARRLRVGLSESEKRSIQLIFSGRQATAKHSTSRLKGVNIENISSVGTLQQERKEM